jgi:DNA repair protein RecO (recombination protein O)
MRCADKAVVLQAIRHGDNKFILKLYTQGHGLLTAASTPGRSASSKVKPAALHPMTLLDVQLSIRQNQEIHRLTEAVPYYIHQHIGSSVTRLSIAQFINEVLVRCLREQQPAGPIFSLIEDSIRRLDSPSDDANLHLYFMRELAGLMGFEPHNNFSSERPYFDCREGGFTTLSLSFPLGLNKEDSALFSAFLSSDSPGTALGRTQRQALLEILSAYFRLHVPAFNELKSLPVLREVLNA